MARTYEFVIGKAEAGLRLDHYLLRRLPSEMSRSVIQRRIREGCVTNGAQPLKVNRKLREGETIIARFEELPPRSQGTPLIPQAIPLEILYEDDQLLVVNKPPGLVTHPAPGHWDGTLVNAILWHLQQAQGSGLMAQGDGTPSRSSSEPPALNPEPMLSRAGIVHRLDKDTSGLLIVAKTERAHTILSKHLKARTIKRRYLAIIEGHLPMDQGTINVAIGRHLRHRKEMTVRHLGGRAAVTHYRVIKRDIAQGSRLKVVGKSENVQPPASSLQPTSSFSYSVLEVSLETGRTHQIRVHMAHLGHPVAGDVVYGKRSSNYWQTLGITRQLLHARAIQFPHPSSSKLMECSAPVPDDMQRWL